MTLRFSPALQNFIAENGCWKNFFDGGALDIYTGAQPATPDLAPTGNLLVTITSGGGALTNEVPATGLVTLSGTTSGSVDTLTLAGISLISAAVPYNTSLNQTATDVATNINRNPANRLVVASTTGASAVITLTARSGFGTALNGLTIATTSTGLTSTATTNMGTGSGGSTAGVASVNGLKMSYGASAGAMVKDPTQTWSGTATGAGTQTAGWFRYRASLADPNTLDSSAVYRRMDGSIATSGADLNMSNTAVANGAVQTLSSFTFTVPAV